MNILSRSVFIAYMSSPAHIELIAEEKNDEISKEKEVVTLKVSKKQAAKARSIKVGGGI